MVFGGIFGVIIKCTLADSIGFEFASRNRHRLMQVQAAILAISLVLNVTVLVASLMIEASVVHAMPLAKLMHEKTWSKGSDGVEVPFATVPSPEWIGSINFERVCVNYYVPGVPSFCNPYTTMDAWDTMSMTGDRSAWIDPSTNTLCALGAPYALSRGGITTLNGDWIEKGLAALFPFSPGAPYVQPGGACVDAFQGLATIFTYGNFSGRDLTCYVAPAGNAAPSAAAAALSPNPLSKWTDHVGCYPPRPECTAMPCSDLGLTLNDDQLRPQIWDVCSAAGFSTQILLICMVALGALKVLLLAYFGMREDPKHDKDKKGFNLITLIVPFVGMIINIVYFQTHCIDVLTAYDAYRFERQSNSMVYSRAVPSWGISLLLMCFAVALYVPCILIELSIPAGQHAFRGSNIAPPPPPGATSSSTGLANPAQEPASKAEGNGILSRMIAGARGTLPMVAIAGEPSKDPEKATPPSVPASAHEWQHALRLMLSSAAQCLNGQMQPWHHAGEGLAEAEPRFHVLAWEGPRAGECNADTVTLSELVELCEQGMIPGDTVVWPQGFTAADGAAWRPASQIVDASKRIGEEQEQQTSSWWPVWKRES